MSYNIAVVGATGNVGREIIRTLSDRGFPVNSIYALASQKSVGKEISFGEKNIKVSLLEKFDFSKVDITFFSAGSDISKEYVPIAAKYSLVVDNSSFFRMDKDVPLIIPEVNPQDFAAYKKKNIIANPNCAAIQLLVALKPLHDVAKIKRVVVSTYQSVSGAGKESMDELFEQTKAKYMNNNLPAINFPKQITFNIIPQIGEFDENGNTGEENKIISEVKKILDPNIEVSATCVRIPVFLCHSESVNVEFENPLAPDAARKILRKAPGVIVMDSARSRDYITPIEAVGDDEVYVSRIRKDESVKNGLNLWVVSDNLRKGAALNAVQIAEIYINQQN